MFGAFGDAAPPPSYIERALDLLHETLVDRGSQYSEEGEFANFNGQATIAGISPRQVFRGMLGQKLSREMSQSAKGFDRFDSVLDVGGYAVLWLAWEMKERDEHEASS